ADLSGDHTESGIENSIGAGVGRQLRSGASLSARIALDLVNLLTLDRASSFGIFADATVSIPLLRGSGKHIVSEPLRQAERNVIYAIHSFERFKRSLAVRVAREYLSVLRLQDRVKNDEDYYRRLLKSTRRAHRMADAARFRAIQVDQARQDELRARNRWIRTQQSYARGLDSFKITLGLPTDANIELDEAELERLAEAAKEVMDIESSKAAPAGSQTQSTAAADAPIELVPASREDGGPFELEPSEAVRLALEYRLDLRTALGRVYDAQRGVVVAADNLRAELTLAGRAQAGSRRSISSADSPNAQLRPEKGFYSVGLFLDLPLERTAERNAYRDSFISLERAVRSVQELEDQIKLGVRNDLRNLLEARESTKIQALSVRVAQRRVASTDLLLKAGDVEMRDVLEAQEALVSAQNDLTSALVDYRVAELELQLDMDVLEVSEKGLWREYEPEDDKSE
ncbi:MAG: TolC family protein, partial [Phycisphaerae bacterium]|nr:TolC family protein [Phycisphaerae bacterium]